MIREEAEPAWNKIVSLGFSEYSKLTREQRVWFNIEPLLAFGLWEHYVNYGADKNIDVIEDLEYLNFQSIANRLNEFNKIYFPEGVPKGPDARQEHFDNFSKEQLSDDIDRMDEKFWELHEDLNNALTAHINKTGIGK
ncbi:MAG: DUF4375 domain-containing protein [Winogradskyella sp.]|uniref:DMP19 family protein n=1 Tax=Winogradskyella sp. TaxID=1883156 RepID=UPI00385A59E6